MQSVIKLVIKVIKRLLRIPSGVVLRYRVYSAETNANKKYLLKKQTDLFSKNGLNRDSAIDLLKNITLELFNEKFDEDEGMFSEHLVLFSAISLSSNFKIDSVLEIGTFDGKTTAILSKLFPRSSITSIDLEDESDKFKETYNRSNNYSEFNNNRDKLISQFENISFKSLNSINLVNWTEKNFDLIWIDGAHGYPVVAIDIINSIRLINFNGVILVDDVWTQNKVNDEMYKSIGAFESLKSLQDAKTIDGFELFLKRLAPKHNVFNNQKFVGFIKI
jgi:predicted O-methyltransferase YrrM